MPSVHPCKSYNRMSTSIHITHTVTCIAIVCGQAWSCEENADSGNEKQPNWSAYIYIYVYIYIYMYIYIYIYISRERERCMHI